MHSLAFGIGWLMAITVSSTVSSAQQLTKVPAPIFEDPNYHGSCDPEIVFNPALKKWTLYYTARRATREKATYVGTPIGLISSPDLATWTFEGYCDFTDASGDTVKGSPDLPVTFWAPGIIMKGDELHMFVTFKNSATPPWGGKGEIRHYVASVKDALHGWKQLAPPNFTQPDPIDATLMFDEAAKTYRAYYRVGRDPGDKQDGGIHTATSIDLLTWTNEGPAKGEINTIGRDRFGYQEAPYVFQFSGAWWMLTDPHKGLGVYRSKDGITWTYNTTVLLEPGKRSMDGSLGRHPSVAVAGDRAFLVYHVEPNRFYGEKAPGPEERTVEQKKSVLQLCELTVEDGKLVARRDDAISPLSTEAK